MCVIDCTVIYFQMTRGCTGSPRSLCIVPNLKAACPDAQRMLRHDPLSASTTDCCTSGGSTLSLAPELGGITSVTNPSFLLLPVTWAGKRNRPDTPLTAVWIRLRHSFGITSTDSGLTTCSATTVTTSSTGYYVSSHPTRVSMTTHATGTSGDLRNPAVSWQSPISSSKPSETWPPGGVIMTSDMPWNKRSATEQQKSRLHTTKLYHSQRGIRSIVPT